ncbi:MAG TPA: family 16 glycosylhydrolase [Bryobacteraceae bacterium]|jgi:beta-glucanase (GH16 family)|nr:family 16 glycosylhydrolase [Bryobacteraceae bacterium]
MKVVALITFSAILLAQKPPGAPGWTLTFADEFSGGELDLTKWSPHKPLNGGEALAKYTVSGGQLHLTRGAISTFGLFSQRAGRFEIQCRVSGGSGTTSGVHLLPLPLGPLPAIDIFEVEGDAPKKISLANHWGTEQTERSYGDAFDVPDLSSGLHTIAMEWDREKIVWFVDGKEEFRSSEGVPWQPMFLTIEIRGGTGTASSFDVDSVRVYRRP